MTIATCPRTVSEPPTIGDREQAAGDSQHFPREIVIADAVFVKGARICMGDASLAESSRVAWQCSCSRRYIAQVSRRACSARS